MEMKELAKAFEEKPKKRILPIVTLIAGVVFLIVGVVLLVVKMNTTAVADAERLVELGTFKKEGEAGVVWQFTEVGKGKLTTNNHVNDYDFIWAIEDGKLKIETAWLYDLEDEFEYKIDGEKLILDNEIVFLPMTD